MWVHTAYDEVHFYMRQAESCSAGPAIMPGGQEVTGWQVVIYDGPVSQLPVLLCLLLCTHLIHFTAITRSPFDVTNTQTAKQIHTQDCTDSAVVCPNKLQTLRCWHTKLNLAALWSAEVSRFDFCPAEDWLCLVMLHGVKVLKIKHSIKNGGLSFSCCLFFRLRHD